MKFIPVAVIAFALMFLPTDAVLAQTGLVTCSGADCGSCQLVAMINLIIVWLIGILFILFAVMMVVAGFGLVTSGGNQSALDAAKSKFQNALIGIIIVLAAWLIVDTVMKGLVGGGSSGAAMGELVGWGPWSQVQCTAQAVPHEYVETNPEPAGTVPTDPSAPSAPGTPLTQAEAASRLSAAGVGVKPGARLEGIQPHVIDGVIALNRSCGCNIVVTEGTGGTHQNGTYSHSNGYKLDLRTNNNPALVSYVQNNFTPGAPWRDGTRTYVNGNATYAVERDHIDVVYRP